MTTLGIASMAALSGLGAALFAAGLFGRQVLPAGTGTSIRRAIEGPGLARLGVAAVSALAVLALTGWLAGAALAVAVAFFGPRVLGGKSDRQAVVERTEAIASWTEMIRDSIAAASGLEEAIVATGPVAPAAIEPEVRRLVLRLRHASLADSLARFGDEVAHPSADLVVAALTIAARMEASDLSGLLSRLAESIRGETRMRIRVEVGRTQVRTATKIIIGVVGAAVLMFTVLSPQYLDAYDSPGGQLVLIVVGGVFALGGWLLTRMAELDLPDRFTARRTVEVWR
jgi:tight adherence protein B